MRWRRQRGQRTRPVALGHHTQQQRPPATLGRALSVGRDQTAVGEGLGRRTYRRRTRQRRQDTTEEAVWPRDSFLFQRAGLQHGSGPGTRPVGGAPQGSGGGGQQTRPTAGAGSTLGKSQGSAPEHRVLAEAGRGAGSWDQGALGGLLFLSEHKIIFRKSQFYLWPTSY